MEFLTRPRADGTFRSRQQPVLVFTGPHGSGKTALLDKLEEWLEPVAPYARIDCAADDLSSSPRVLSALVFELNRTAGRYGRLAFPRFITGQLVLRQERVTDDRVRACGQVRQALAEYRNIAALRDFLVEIGEDAWTVLHHGQAPPVSRTGVRYLAKLILNGLIASRLGRRVLLGKGLDWYGHQDRGLRRDPLDELVDPNVAERRFPGRAGQLHPGRRVPRGTVQRAAQLGCAGCAVQCAVRQPARPEPPGHDPLCGPGR